MTVVYAVISNLITIPGVLWFNWNLSWILFLYAIESLIIGAFNIQKIKHASAKPKSTKTLPKNPAISGNIKLKLNINGKEIKKWDTRAFVIFFAVMYGLIVLTFLVLLLIFLPLNNFSFWGFLLWVIAVSLEHWKNLQDYMSSRQYDIYTKAQQTLLPFVRLFVLGIPVILATSLQSASDNLFVLFALVGTKLTIDLILILKPSTLLLIKYGDTREVISTEN